MLYSIGFSQTRFNKIVDLDRNAHHILVSVTPNDSVYIIVCGTDDYEQPGDRRCSLIATLDSCGVCLNKTVVSDSTTNIYEGWYHQKIYVTNNNTYKYVFDKHSLGAYICEFNDNLDIVGSKTYYFSNDSTLTDARFLTFSIVLLYYP